jgi:hypothetical protein
MTADVKTISSSYLRAVPKPMVVTMPDGDFTRIIIIPIYFMMNAGASRS